MKDADPAIRDALRQAANPQTPTGDAAMFDAITTAPAASTPVPAASRVRIVHAGGTLDVELLPGSSTVLDLTASKGERRGATKAFGFLGVVALVAGAGWAGSTLMAPRAPAPAPAVADVAPWRQRAPVGPSARQVGPSAWQVPPGPPEAVPQEPVPAAPVPPPPVPPAPAGRDPFGLVQP